MIHQLKLSATTGLALVFWGQHVMAQSYLVSGTAEAPLRGAYEVTLTTTSSITNGFLQNDLQVTFTRDDGTQVTTNGFYDGGNTFKAWAYLDSAGDWSWNSSSTLPGLNGGSGSFTVVNNVDLPGKLRKSTEDSRQFAQDNGQWFLHLGDTGYRYINGQEPRWQAYLDQSADVGFSKVRTWFGNVGGGVNGNIDYMFQGDSLNLNELRTADQRLTYALNNHPEMQMQLIPFGEDSNKLKDFANNVPLVRAYAREVQARFGALPNVQWCLSNDRHLANDTTLRNVVDTLGTEWDAADAWGTLITNHQARYESYSFVNAPWSDIVTFENLDEVAGEEILGYRNNGDQDPIVNDEDRYETYRNPANDRYFFRRLMWGSLLSGGAATYGGGRTWEPYAGASSSRGVQGYQDLNNAGLLQGGADHFKFIGQFFDDTDLTLINMTPDDALVEFFSGPSTQPTFLPTGGPDGSGALEFDGVDDDGFAFNVWTGPLNGDISIDFSMRPDSLPDLNGDNFLGLVSVTPMRMYLVDDGSGTGKVLALTFDSNGNPTFGFSHGGLALGQWHEVHAQVVDGTLDVEVDGITTSYTLDSGIMASSEPAAVFGRDMSALTRYFDGALDEVRIATTVAVPEPAATMLMLLGSGGLTLLRQRR